MSKLPEINISYFHKPQIVPVEILYAKNQSYYRVYVYTLAKQGKGISFSSEEKGNPWGKIFRKLTNKDVKTRLRVLKYLLKELENQIKERKIPYTGTIKLKHLPSNSINNQPFKRILICQ